ncbi:EAL domain-containing protein [Actinospica durhamensis]|uniref:EAL domain-containing protein n=1 Tax=Actinospica durhamensis TaxID=1508375 RepID=A0A941ER72_9ACTN|nr:GGDEF domain-containing phosphodiesterase [Actinospica durhamensis]MBR7835673.1 EAL domain-containing protein [Actinospica durhamensis]
MRVLLAAGLVAAALCLPDHVGAGWTIFGTAAVVALSVAVWIHPPAYRTPLYWGLGALVCMLAAQLCVLAGVRSHPPRGASLVDLFVFAACVAAAGVLAGTISRRVRGWDPGFLLDVTIVVAGATATIWLYLIAPYVVHDPDQLLLARLTLTMYPALSMILIVLTVMLVRGAAQTSRGIAVVVMGVAGLVFSNVFMLVTRVNDATSQGFWTNAAVAGAGWMFFQLCWAAAPLHVPGPRCPSAAGRWPRRPMTVRRLVVLLVVALANPVILNIQISRGQVAPLGHFPVVGGAVFLAVIARLSFVGADHLDSVRRLNTLIEAQPRISSAPSTTELAQVAAEIAGNLLGGRGEASVILVTGGRLSVGSWHEPEALLKPDPDHWRTMAVTWGPNEPGVPLERFLGPEEVAYRDGVGSVTALACPIHTARSRAEGRPPGLLVVAGTRGRVTDAADPLALLAAQVGESLERIGVTMRMARSHLRAMTASVSDAILVIDDEGVVRYANIAAEALFGGRAGQGRELAELVGPEHARALATSADNSTLRWTLPGGDHIVEAAVDDRRADPTVEGLVLTLRDVTKLHTLENELRRRATHDQETGLENRLAFTTHLAQVRAGEGTAFGVLAVAVDDLPEITEESGADHANRVLDEFARRLVGVFGLERPEVARVDAATLALLVVGTPSLPSPETLLGRVRAVGSRPLIIADRAVTVSVSAGFAAFPGDGPSEQALEDALLALRAAQRNSPRGLAAFDPEMRETSREQAEMRAGLNEALSDGAFWLEYQPVVDLATRLPLGAEALIRWRKPDGTRVRPDVFVPFAEQTGQIVPMGAWVLRRALQDYLSWPRLGQGADGNGRLRVNVNVSPVQLREPDFLGQVRALLGETGLPPASLVLEVTESGIVAQVETLVQARALGVGVAMDDFGTGYSSLSSLRRLPISTVKIDKAFVDGIATDPVQYALVEGIVRLADELGLTTVAEGVELEEQHARLLAAGCRCGQGYLYSRPLPAADFEAWLRESVEPSERPGRQAPGGT